MASIAASPVYPDGLKKRSRLLSAAETFDVARKKRFRGGDAPGGGEDGAAQAAAADAPKYSQRHVDYFEQVKQAEVARIRTEYEQYIMKREAELQRCRQELGAAHERLQQQDREVERLQGENRLLKRAITIQNQQKEEAQHESAVLKGLAAQAAEHIKRLEQANYTLRVHLQTSTSASVSQQQPPDVF